jgi:hypothetical protein
MHAPAFRLRTAAGLVAWTLALTSAAGATMLPGGGSRRTDCIAELSATGTAFPAGRRVLGVTCADGDACDQDRRWPSRSRMWHCYDSHASPPSVAHLLLRHVEEGLHAPT